MSVTRGWWMSWASSYPRRSGAFKVEIIERSQNTIMEQFEKRFDQIKGKIGRPSISLGAVGGMGNVGALNAMGALSSRDLTHSQSISAPSNSPLGNQQSVGGLVGAGGAGSIGGAGGGGGGLPSAAASINEDTILRHGDFFRLRSVKFPEYELGVTIDRVKDDYCYCGLRKVC